MALTGLTNLQPLHIKTVGIGTFDNTVSVGGTLTYEDVTNVDAIGIITARSGVNVSGGQLDVGSNIKLGNAGVITATSFVGSGSGLTGLNSDLVNDTSPQLGGNLDTNSHEISLDTSHAINFGDSNELRVFYHSGNGQIDFNGNTSLQLKTPANKYFQVVNRDNGNNIIQAQAGGVVQLYHNGAKKFDTTTTGVRVHGDEGGTAQLQLLADQGDDNPDYWRFIAETNGILNIQDYGSGSWYNNIRLTGHTGGVELYHDNSKKFETGSDHVTVTGSGNDAAGISYIKFKSGNASHRANIGKLSSSNGTLSIMNLDNASIFFGTSASNKLELQDGGHLLPVANGSYDLGGSSNRWRNIYTNDLNLSNKGSTNSVDNTWGDYTIQEGESDLFLINNRNGKKYKFNLTEVS
jgi:hypothetical protein